MATPAVQSFPGTRRTAGPARGQAAGLYQQEKAPRSPRKGWQFLLLHSHSHCRTYSLSHQSMSRFPYVLQGEEERQGLLFFGNTAGLLLRVSIHAKTDSLQAGTAQTCEGQARKKARTCLRRRGHYQKMRTLEENFHRVQHKWGRVSGVCSGGWDQMLMALSVLLSGTLSVCCMITASLRACNVGLSLVLIAREANTTSSSCLVSTLSCSSPGTEVTWAFFTGFSS